MYERIYQKRLDDNQAERIRLTRLERELEERERQLRERKMEFARKKVMLKKDRKIIEKGRHIVERDKTWRRGIERCGVGTENNS